MTFFLPTCHMQPLDSSLGGLLVKQEPAQASPYGTLSEFSTMKGLCSWVPKSWFYIPFHECAGMKWPGAQERLLHHWCGAADGVADVVKGSYGLELGPDCRGPDIFKISMVLPISSAPFSGSHSILGFPIYDPLLLNVYSCLGPWFCPFLTPRLAVSLAQGLLCILLVLPGPSSESA